MLTIKNKRIKVNIHNLSNEKCKNLLKIRNFTIHASIKYTIILLYIVPFFFFAYFNLNLWGKNNIILSWKKLVDFRKQFMIVGLYKTYFLVIISDCFLEFSFFNFLWAFSIILLQRQVSKFDFCITVPDYTKKTLTLTILTLFLLIFLEIPMAICFKFFLLNQTILLTLMQNTNIKRDIVNRLYFYYKIVFSLSKKK